VNSCNVTAAIAILLATAGSVCAADHEVKMLNKGADGEVMVFEPEFLQIDVGDTVTFVPTDKGHNAEVIKEMVPEGGTEFKGKINEQISVTFDVPGAYGYKCLPHFGMGMVGLIVVGDDPANLKDIENAKAPPRAKQEFTELISMVGR
jgi:pseudoazurin